MSLWDSAQNTVLGGARRPLTLQIGLGDTELFSFPLGGEVSRSSLGVWPWGSSAPHFSLSFNWGWLHHLANWLSHFQSLKGLIRLIFLTGVGPSHGSLAYCWFGHVWMCSEEALLRSEVHRSSRSVHTALSCFCLIGLHHFPLLSLVPPMLTPYSLSNSCRLLLNYLYI